jgi:hypothetical protein
MMEITPQPQISKFKEIQIINGNVVKNVELEEIIIDDIDLIKGHVNNIPVNISLKLKDKKGIINGDVEKSRKSKKSKKSKKSRKSRKSKKSKKSKKGKTKKKQSKK